MDFCISAGIIQSTSTSLPKLTPRLNVNECRKYMLCRRNAVSFVEFLMICRLLLVVVLVLLLVAVFWFARSINFINFRFEFTRHCYVK